MDNLAKEIRKSVINMTYKAKSSHIGSCLSCADILAVLYGKVLIFDSSDPEWKDRDRFIMSKGHAAAALYAVLAECGFIPKEMLGTFYTDGSLLMGHTNHHVSGVEVSTGALGHGLSIGCGMALSTKSKVYVLLGDGDCNEGSTWEAVMFAYQHKLNNLVVVIDYNKLQGLGDSKEIIDFGTMASKWEHFGWETRTVDGHDINGLIEVFKYKKTESGKPLCIIANTIKGKGVSFIENKAEWHYRTLNEADYKNALEELS